MENNSLEWQNIFEEDILKYSDIIFDEEKIVNAAYVRIRKLRCNNKYYIHIMVNGECIYCEKINI